MLNFVWMRGLYRAHPPRHHHRESSACIRGRQSCNSSRVLPYSPGCVDSRVQRYRPRHRRYEARNSIDDQAQTLFAGADGRFAALQFDSFRPRVTRVAPRAQSSTAAS